MKLDRDKREIELKAQLLNIPRADLPMAAIGHAKIAANVRTVRDRGKPRPRLLVVSAHVGHESGGANCAPISRLRAT